MINDKPNSPKKPNGYPNDIPSELELKWKKEQLAFYYKRYGRDHANIVYGRKIQLIKNRILELVRRNER